LIEINQHVIDDSSRVFSALARGDMSQTIDRDYQGSFGELKDSANSSVAKQAQVTEVIGRDFHMVVDSAVHGDLSQRIDTSIYEGVFAQLGTELNELMEIAEQGLGNIGRVLQALSQGELNQHIDGEYQGVWGELKTDANATVDKLQEVVGEISQTAAEVNRGSANISQGNSELSSRTEQQAASLEETSATMEQMTASVRQNADNAKHADTLAKGARDSAEIGSGVVGQAVTAMNEISASSNKIASIIGVIDEIAFQTNLLALNAAVEAARAGEHGRGFAVVASEVRNLAGRSATAAKEIQALIQDSGIRVEEGSKLVGRSGEVLAEINSSVGEVSKIVAEIALASAEQSSGIDEVGKAVAHMDDMTQQNAALVEESAAASELLSEQSDELDHLIGFFNVSSTNDEVLTSQLKPQKQAQSEEPKLARSTAAQQVSEEETVGAEVEDCWDEF